MCVRICLPTLHTFQCLVEGDVVIVGGLEKSPIPN